jgi:predicted sulfurtransferase
MLRAIDRQVVATAMSPDDYNRWRIALYYCYIEVPDVQRHVDFQRTACGKLHLTGRIRVAPEGINGVLSGEHGRLREYEVALRDELKAIVRDEGAAARFELDVKYCRLREDLPLQDQLFDSLVVQETKRVVSLVDEPSQHPKRGRTKNGKSTSSEVQEIWEAVRKETVATGDSHLSPADWDRKLASIGPHENAILLDCRNSYESAVGYFEAPNATTLLTNTRKYSELPGVFLEQRDRLASCTHVFAYCTGGVRCEMASKFLRRLLEDPASGGDGSGGPEIFQLHGGIQRYLEQHELNEALPLQNDEPTSSNQGYFKGKNFVFDPRRTDPVHGATQVGQCMVCGTPHDDYDNGHAPAAGTGESRCVNCRVLLLVCPTCRPTVTCWGQEDKQHDGDGIAAAGIQPKLYCGGLNGPCLHKPPVRLVVNAESVAL